MAPPPDPVFLERACAAVADVARRTRVAVVLGTERVTDRGLQITACVITPDGTLAGWQDKGQIDPSEEGNYPALGAERRVFSVGPLTFGVAICHEGFRYPETVRWASCAPRRTVPCLADVARHGTAAASRRRAIVSSLRGGSGV